MIKCKKIYKLLFKKRRTSMFFGFRLSDTNCPALENSLSDGTEEPGMHKYFLALCMSQGNRC